MSGKILSGPAAVLLLAFFFFPWVLVSNNDTALVELSGYQLALGIPPEGLSDALTTENMQGEPILFAIPLTGIVTLILLGVTLWKANFEQNAAWGQIILAALTGLILIMASRNLQQNSDPNLTLTFLAALWGSFLALLAITGGAIFDLALWRRARSSKKVEAAPPLAKQSFSSQPEWAPSSPPSLEEPATNETNLPARSSASQATIVDDHFDTPAELSNATIVDDNFDTPSDRSKATIVDEKFDINPDKGLATIVDDDFEAPSDMSKATIVDDNFGGIPEQGQATIVDDNFSGSFQDNPGNIAKTEILHFNPAASAKLIVEDGDEIGKQYTIFNNTSVGRVLDNDIVIDDTAMSSYHAYFIEENGRFSIHDKNSTNGVYILQAGQSHWEKQNIYELNDGDKIKLGRAVLQFST